MLATFARSYKIKVGGGSPDKVSEKTKELIFVIWHPKFPLPVSQTPLQCL